jgi:hypothetical protein
VRGSRGSGKLAVLTGFCPYCLKELESLDTLLPDSRVFSTISCSNCRYQFVIGLSSWSMPRMRLVEA